MLSALLHRRARTLTCNAVEEWILDIQRLSISTQKDYTRIIKEFTFDLPKNVSHITSTDVNRYLSKKSWTHENTTVNKHLMAIKSFFRFLEGAYQITNITTKLRKTLKSDPKREGYYIDAGSYRTPMFGTLLFASRKFITKSFLNNHTGERGQD